MTNMLRLEKSGSFPGLKKVEWIWIQPYLTWKPEVFAAYPVASGTDGLSEQKAFYGLSEHISSRGIIYNHFIMCPTSPRGQGFVSIRSALILIY